VCFNKLTDLLTYLLTYLHRHTGNIGIKKGMAKNAGVQNAGEPNEDIIGSMESEISIGVTHKSECRSTIDVISVTVQDIVH